MTEPVDILLHVALRHRVVAASAEEACERVTALAGGALSAVAFHEAVAQCVRRGLIRETVRLEEGALHCRWRLELTPSGVAAARAAAQLAEADGSPSSTSASA